MSFVKNMIENVNLLILPSLSPVSMWNMEVIYHISNIPTLKLLEMGYPLIYAVT